MKFQDADIMMVTPCYGGIEIETMTCMVKLYEWSKYYAPSDGKTLPVNRIEWRFAKATSPAWVRNSAADMFMESKAKSLLMLDRDHIFHHENLKVLFEADKDIIAALATTKIESLEDHKKPIVPLTSRVVDNKVIGITQEDVNKMVKENGGEPFEVDMTGMGMILIKRKVFEKIGRPWFAQPESNFENNPQGCSGEDYYFSKKALDAGIKTYVHPGCAMLHIGKGYYGMGS